MSLAPDNVYCSGCDYEARILHGAAVCLYHLPDGSVHQHHRTRGWCYTRQEVREIEDLSDLLALQQEITDLQPLQPAPVETIARLQTQLKAFGSRTSPARCLTCGSTHISPGVIGHVHACGGTLYAEAEPSGIRFAMKEREYLLDHEGCLLSKGAR